MAAPPTVSPTQRRKLSASARSWSLTSSESLRSAIVRATRSSRSRPLAESPRRSTAWRRRRWPSDPGATARRSASGARPRCRRAARPAGAADLPLPGGRHPAADRGRRLSRRARRPRRRPGRGRARAGRCGRVGGRRAGPGRSGPLPGCRSRPRPATPAGRRGRGSSRPRAGSGRASGRPPGGGRRSRAPSSSGWRSTSSVARRNSGSSSRKRTPLWARLTSPGRGRCAAAHEGDVARRVVRAPERPRGRRPPRPAGPRPSGSPPSRPPRRARAGQDSRQAPGQHRLARAGRADEAAGCARRRRRSRAPGAPGPGRGRRPGRPSGCQPSFAGRAREAPAGSWSAARRASASCSVAAGCTGRPGARAASRWFAAGTMAAPQPVPAREEQHREDAGHRAQGAVEGHLAHEQHVGQVRQREGPVGGQEPDRGGEVEGRAVLAKAGGGEVDGDAAVPLEGDARSCAAPRGCGTRSPSRRSRRARPW